MTASIGFGYRRPALALQYCEALTGQSIIDARSGLFLAAPRRTGKSTFLRNDLVPALKAQGWEVVYIDLWVDKAAAPARLISKAVKAALGQHAGMIAKLAKKSGLEKINLFGTLSVNVNALDLPVDVTLADALEALSIAADRPVAIIVDEAQHAISTQEGMDAMFALKAARDHLNQGGEQPQKLFLVFTGSNQDKLSKLVQRKSQPFYGCGVTKFQLLDKGYSDQYCEYINAKLAENNQFTKEAMWHAFRLVGQRPEMLSTLIADCALGDGADHLEASLKAGAENFRQVIWGEMESDFNALTLIQRAVLVRLIDTGAHYEPFNEASLKAYSAYVGKQVTPSDAQASLNALREKNLVWKATHGEYALEEENMATWYNTQIKPKLPQLPPADISSNEAKLAAGLATKGPVKHKPAKRAKKRP